MLPSIAAHLGAGYNTLMQSVGDVLKKFNPTTDKYISREFQTFAIHLTESLDDYKHKSLYMKLAKTVHRSLLEKALSFAIDSNAKNKGALFMWKLKQLKDEAKKNVIASEAKQSQKDEGIATSPSASSGSSQ